MRGKGSTGGNGLPRAIGHEVSGTVERIGPRVTGLAPGDRVAAWVGGRGFAEYVAVDAAHCFPAGDVPLDLALGEPLACAVNAVERADPKLADDIVIVGAGFMGNLVQVLAQLRGPRNVIVADTRPDALERAMALGATHTVDVRTGVAGRRRQRGYRWPGRRCRVRGHRGPGRTGCGGNGPADGGDAGDRRVSPGRTPHDSARPLELDGLPHRKLPLPRHGHDHCTEWTPA